jgi:polyphosphate glucokinase
VAPRRAIGVDVGGSGIKAAVVDVDEGRLVSTRHRVATPSPSTPERVSASIARIIRSLVKETALEEAVPVGVGLPGVAIEGMLRTAANIDPAWVDYPIAERMSRTLKRPVSIVNDADAAGIAEMRFGIGRGRRGVVIFLTLGTGVGSGVFVDGTLVPNTEFGQMEIRGRPAERRSAAAARRLRGLSWKAWAADLDEHLERIEDMMWPTLFIIGGGVSKNGDKFIPRLTRRTPVLPAELRNDAGIIGAAIVAAEPTDIAAEPPGVAAEPLGVAAEPPDMAAEPSPAATVDERPTASVEAPLATESSGGADPATIQGSDREVPATDERPASPPTG